MKILFFGSDLFSIKSLIPLYNNLQKNGMISHIQVITPPPKRTGRNLLKLKQTILDKSMPLLFQNLPPPIYSLEELSINKDSDSSMFDMCIAVSYGKLIPAELINKLKYSINVHPSLLPQYRGSSPLQYTLLNNDIYTGCSIQTLHPSKFDHGRIIVQTLPLKVDEILQPENVNNETGTLVKYRYDNDDSHVGKFFLSENVIVENSLKIPDSLMLEEQSGNDGPLLLDLKDKMGNVGSLLLNEVISKQLYQCLDTVTDNKCFIPHYKPSYAKKIKNTDREINWNKDTASTIVNKINVLKSVYVRKEVNPKRKDVNDSKSVITKLILLHDATEIRDIDSLENTEQDASVKQVLKCPGDAKYIDSLRQLIIKCHGDTYIGCKNLQFEGFKIEPACKFIKGIYKRSRMPKVPEHNNVITFV
ncbi:uncharacterized protein SCODWIG_00395 [Saccharomycodes ludwigii]|uniref:Methionyl-tRNA formyltransferase n=1 Tax=Saccharomycodes ludwigii TaxID=36035 RepID=A0A376B2C1_9ASCO|nr:hypothetical protein SCDLUD_001473 [Saccharomycodes ludwigii]KAH3901702.1 hypothetical protein SCDLUD_001473 [Saccharomycodes ludwigii]SSD58634.1 uncharacterized protein SCODWIG_00395 [Saccharomycodes ludwigii]